MSLIHFFALLSLFSANLFASSIIITTLPDSERPLAPLASLGGTPLEANSIIRVGAFPGMTPSQLLNNASSGGLSQLSTAFVPFGESFTVGEGADGVAGAFEIVARHNPITPPGSWVGEVVSLLITRPNSDEFLVARFPKIRFQADTETGLEPLISLHLADSELVVGHRFGNFNLTTAPAPSRGSFATWISGFVDIVDPALKQPDADPDGDGRSNFLEYATGGDPLTPAEVLPGRITKTTDGSSWFRLSRTTGIGPIRFVVESSSDLREPWRTVEGTFQVDPSAPTQDETVSWMRILIPETQSLSCFFRLKIDSSAE